MKGKTDLVSGWLRKAASDLIAMQASAKAGASDASCFHAQQAAEKYLKAFLLDCDREIVHTHNLHKLLKLCTEEDSSFVELAVLASLLTPFAVEARYDTEFLAIGRGIAEARMRAEQLSLEQFMKLYQMLS
jgi:HEPN domain-containing protein